MVCSIRLHFKSGTGDDRTSEAYSMVVKDVTLPSLGPELPSKERGSLPSVNRSQYLDRQGRAWKRRCMLSRWESLTNLVNMELKRTLISVGNIVYIFKTDFVITGN